MTVTIDPRKVRISGPGMPLVGTFNKAVAEWAAALLIMACQDRGDFGPTDPLEIGHAIRKRQGLDEFTWMKAMIRSPDFDRLQEDGFIEGMDTEDRTGSISFTEKGLLALEDSPWMIRTPTEEAAYRSAKEMRGEVAS